MRYRLFFNTGGLVAGRGFVAHVAIKGRCLLEHTEPDFFTYFGVSPAASAGQGGTPDEARRSFLDNVKANVFWLAEQADGFERFESELRRFVLEQNVASETDWNEAVRAVRSGEVDTSGYSKRVEAEQAAQVAVRIVDPARERIEPDLNEVRDEPLLACA
ncbi:MAG: hypothetical protein ACREQY_09270 [Candidatus Binatia bacterium]